MAELSKFAEEIMVEILSKLPPKSLMRFKCVRRSWNALMKNPNFVAKHLSSSKRTALSSSSTTIIFRRFLITDLNPKETEIVLSLYNFCSDFEGWFVEDIHFQDSLGIECRGKFHEGVGSLFQIVCHCDGIICLADYAQKPTVVLCNPATKEFKLLPESQLPLSSPEMFPTAAVGFGYDLRLKNYKVIRLIKGGWEFVDQGMVNHPVKAEVYDLLTNCWKEIKSDNLEKEKTIFFPDSNSRTKGIYFKGMIYWTALEEGKFLKYYGDDGYHMEDDDQRMIENAYIISFDLADETFHVTKISPYSECCLILAVLGFWKESLALCVRSGCNFNIWVMDDSAGSWTKYFELDPGVKITSHFAVFGKSEDEPFVLVAACDHDSSELIVFYDIRTNKVNYLQLNGEHLHSTQIVDYVSSIVSLNEGNKHDAGALVLH